jgi:hypothetical protein
MSKILWKKKLATKTQRHKECYSAEWLRYEARVTKKKIFFNKKYLGPWCIGGNNLKGGFT